MAPRGDDDARLVAEARRGDGAAFDALAERSRQGLHGAALRRLGDQEAALDCVQETLLRAWESLPRFRGQCSFATWLHRILEHVCLEEQRRLARQERDARVADLAHDLGLDEVIAEREELRAALRALSQLPLGLRTASLLSLVEGLSHAETGGVLGISAEAVKMRVSRARALLGLPSSPPESLDGVRRALAESYQLIGTLMLRGGRHRGSDRAALQAMRYHPDSAYLLWTRYDRARGTPLFRPAERQAGRILSRWAEWPGGATARVALANFHHFERHDWPKAERLYASVASEAGFAGWVARMHLGALYMNVGRPAKALPLLSRALQEAPEAEYPVVFIARSLAVLRSPGAPAWAKRARAVAMRGWSTGFTEPPRAFGMQTGRLRIVAAEAFLLLGDTRSAGRLATAALEVFPEGYIDDRPQRMLARLGGGTT